jgi:hypothetical protein
MDCKTNILDDEVALAIAMAQGKGKGKGKGKKKVADSGASNNSKSQKASSVPAVREGTKATTTATPDAGARFYEKDGLKIPLYDHDGMGNKKKRCARLSKTLISKHSKKALLDIVEHYAGADKREELKNKGLDKVRLANWIEEKETFALGRNPKSDLPGKSEIDFTIGFYEKTLTLHFKRWD